MHAARHKVRPPVLHCLPPLCQERFSSAVVVRQLLLLEVLYSLTETSKQFLRGAAHLCETGAQWIGVGLVEMYSRRLFVVAQPMRARHVQRRQAAAAGWEMKREERREKKRAFALGLVGNSRQQAEKLPTKQRGALSRSIRTDSPRREKQDVARGGSHRSQEQSRQAVESCVVKAA